MQKAEIKEVDVERDLNELVHYTLKRFRSVTFDLTLASYGSNPLNTQIERNELLRNKMQK